MYKNNSVLQIFSEQFEVIAISTFRVYMGFETISFCKRSTLDIVFKTMWFQLPGVYKVYKHTCDHFNKQVTLLIFENKSFFVRYTVRTVYHCLCQLQHKITKLNKKTKATCSGNC